VAAAIRPGLAEAFAWPDNQALRAEIADVVPSYAGIETLSETGDAIQWGGRHLCADGHFPTANGRGRFTPLEPTAPAGDPTRFHLSMRRGKQFNSIRFAEVDPLTGATRDAVYLDPRDAAALGVADGDPIRLTSMHAHLDGVAKLAVLPARTVQVHWPEGNVLLAADPDHREPRSKIPDYTTTVTITAI
jgi:predicted molibdopterin-dependent oxidoreductase YjgC